MRACGRARWRFCSKLKRLSQRREVRKEKLRKPERQKELSLVFFASWRTPAKVEVRTLEVFFEVSVPHRRADSCPPVGRRSAAGRKQEFADCESGRSTP